jgi:hypothetical protein
VVKYGKCGGGEREENTNRERKGRRRERSKRERGLE